MRLLSQLVAVCAAVQREVVPDAREALKRSQKLFESLQGIARHVPAREPAHSLSFKEQQEATDLINEENPHVLKEPEFHSLTSNEGTEFTLKERKAASALDEIRAEMAKDNDNGDGQHKTVPSLAQEDLVPQIRALTRESLDGDNTLNPHDHHTAELEQRYLEQAAAFTGASVADIAKLAPFGPAQERTSLLMSNLQTESDKQKRREFEALEKKVRADTASRDPAGDRPTERHVVLVPDVGPVQISVPFKSKIFSDSMMDERDRMFQFLEEESRKQSELEHKAVDSIFKPSIDNSAVATQVRKMMVNNQGATRLDDDSSAHLDQMEAEGAATRAQTNNVADELAASGGAGALLQREKGTNKRW